MTDTTSLEDELELISASLLPSETLSSSDPPWPREIKIQNADSGRYLHIHLSDTYPAREAVKVELKGNEIGREESHEWDERIAGYMEDWDADDPYPLFQLLTTHLLPLLAPTEQDKPPNTKPEEEDEQAHHALLTSHHLLSPTKRKDFLALASSLSLTGFSKVGHPGIYYAIGRREDLEEWLREVKSWNWLALRVRVGIEPVDEELGGKGIESGARGGRGRGEWVELEKISEALEWLRKRGREKLLTDIGIGGSSD